MEFRNKCAWILRSIFGWLMIVLGGLWGISGVICAVVALFGGMEIDSFGERLCFFAIFLVMAAGSFAILWLGFRLKNSGRRDKTVPSVKRKSSPVKEKPSLPKKLKQELDTAKKQKIVADRAAKRAEIEKIYRDFVNGEGRLPEGFSEKYNRTTQSGYVLHETPFMEYLHKIWKEVDSLHNRTGISDWIYFDGNVEINAAIEMLTDWVRRHREMNTYLYKSNVAFSLLGHHFYCDHKIMVVMENGDAFRNVTEKSIAFCKAEQISFCTILSECELYDLLEHKAKTIEYTTYPGYHDETYADWWFEDSLMKPKMET